MSKITETTPLAVVSTGNVVIGRDDDDIELTRSEGQITFGDRDAQLAEADRKIAELEARIARIEWVAANAAVQVSCIEVGTSRRGILGLGLGNGPTTLRMLSGSVSVGAFEKYRDELIQVMRNGGDGGGRGDGST